MPTDRRLNDIVKNKGKFKCLLLSERSQSEKAKCHRVAMIWHSVKCETMEIEIRSVLARDKEEEEERISWTQRIFRGVKPASRVLSQETSQ